MHRLVPRLVPMLAAAGLVASLAPAARANLVTPGFNDTITINGSCDNAIVCNSTTDPANQISAEAVLSDFVFSSDLSSLTFTVQLTNTTQQGTYTNSQYAGINLTAFGFNTNPSTATGLVQTTAKGGDSQFFVYEQDNFPGYNTVDVCLSTGTNCAGGSNNGLTPNQTDTFNLTGLTGSLDLGTRIPILPENYEFMVTGIPGVGSVEFSGPGKESPCIPGQPGCLSGTPTDVPNRVPSP